VTEFPFIKCVKTNIFAIQYADIWQAAMSLTFLLNEEKKLIFLVEDILI
jgi:hypothetical protein